jgi:hypothetical protein
MSRFTATNLDIFQWESWDLAHASVLKTIQILTSAEVLVQFEYEDTHGARARPCWSTVGHTP